MEGIEEILKTNLELEIAIGVEENIEITIPITFLKSDIIGKYKNWYKKHNNKSPIDTFILFAKNKEFDPKPFGKCFDTDEYYLIEQEKFKYLLAKFDLDKIFNSINQEILKSLEKSDYVEVVANSEEYYSITKAIEKHSDNNFYEIKPSSNTLVGFHAGYKLGIYTIEDYYGTKVHFSIKKIYSEYTEENNRNNNIKITYK